MTRWVLWLLLMLLPMTAAAKEVELLPAGTVWADGATRTVVMVRVEGAAPGDRIKVKTKEARIRSTKVVGPELVRIVLVPLVRTQPGRLSLQIKAKGASGTVELPVVPGPTGSLSIEPATELAWAGSGSVLIRIKPVGAHPVSERKRRVLLHASAGRITSAPVASKSGGWIARWTPPSASGAPVAVLFTATDLSAPERVLGQTSLPVQVRRTVSVPVPEGAVVVYDGVSSDPVHGGTWTSRVVLHPEKLPASLQTLTPEDKLVESPLDLGDPVPPQLAFAPLPPKLPTPRPVTLWLAARNPDGSPWSGSAPQLDGVGRFRSAGDGWYFLRVQPPAQAGPWELSASIDGAVATARVKLEPEPPRADLAVYPFPIPPDARAVTLVVSLEDRDGEGVSGVVVNPRGKGFSTQTSRVDEGDGTYVWTLRPTSSKPLVVGTKVSLPTSRLPVAHVLAWTPSPLVPADGKSTTHVTLVAVDALGRPVPKVRFDLVVPVGDAQVPARVYADSSGFATVKVIAGTRPGPVGLEARTSSVNGAVVLYQASSAGTPSLEPLGTAPTRDYTARWAAANPRLGVTRGPATVAERPAKVEEAPAVSLLDRARLATSDASEEGEDDSADTGRPQASDDAEEPDEPAPKRVRTPLSGAGSDSDASLVRVRLAVADTGYDVRHSSGGRDGFPTDIGTLRALPQGIVEPTLDAEYFPARWHAGVDLRLRGRGLGWASEHGDLPDFTTSAVLGLTWRQPIWGPLSATGGLAAHRAGALYYRYADDAETVLVPLKHAWWGPRLSAGVRLDLPRIQARAEAAETLGPLYPVRTHLGAQLDVVVWEFVTASVAVAHERTTMTLSTADEDVVLKDQLTVVSLGGGIVF